ncbi:hypothetical protein B0H19DRAFT_1257555 [Mycena capillaripes]|nr:hypothetical protein B0H19DRAFT_1257555 [Mycena capillaripes]
MPNDAFVGLLFFKARFLLSIERALTFAFTYVGRITILSLARVLWTLDSTSPPMCLFLLVLRFADDWNSGWNPSQLIRELHFSPSCSRNLNTQHWPHRRHPRALLSYHPRPAIPAPPPPARGLTFEAQDACRIDIITSHLVKFPLKILPHLRAPPAAAARCTSPGKCRPSARSARDDAREDRIGTRVALTRQSSSLRFMRGIAGIEAQATSSFALGLSDEPPPGYSEYMGARNGAINRCCLARRAPRSSSRGFLPIITSEPPSMRAETSGAMDVLILGNTNQSGLERTGTGCIYFATGNTS